MVATRAAFPRILLSAVLSFGAGLLALIAAGFLVSMVPALSNSTSALLLLPVAFVGTAMATATVTLDIGGRRDSSANGDVPQSVLGDMYAPLAPRSGSAPAVDALPSPLFAQACVVLLTPKPPRFGTAAILIVSASLFALSWMGGSLIDFALIAAVLAFHEAGHLVAMRLFGYSDLRVFFIPFFGAAAAGKKEGAPGWQQALVLLMGPVPGLALGALVLHGADATTPSLLMHGAKMLVWVNALNLLPLEPFDGGRLLHVLLFSRHHSLELLFLLFASVAVGLLGFALHTPAFYVLALLGLAMAPARARMTKTAIALRRQWGEVRLASAPDGYLRALFMEAEKTIQPRSRTAAAMAGYMRPVHDRAAVAPLGAAASLTLLALYGVTCALAMAGTVLGAAHG